MDPNTRFRAYEDQTAMHAAAALGSIGTVFLLKQVSLFVISKECIVILCVNLNKDLFHRTDFHEAFHFPFIY